VDLGSAATVNRVVLRLPASWGTRTQTLSVQGSTNGSTFTTAVGAATYTFSQGTNAVTIQVPGTSMRYVRINVTANTGWPAAQVSQFEVYGGAANPGDTQAPSAPTNLTVTGHTATSATLSWSASTDNVGVTGYQVLRSGTLVASPTGTTATVTGLSPATAYSFTVVARDAAGNTSAPSNTATVTTDAAPNTNLAAGKATAESSHTQTYASGNAVDGNANSYWESANNAFPQWIQVDLGTAMTVGRLVLKLPPATAWATRSQTLTVQASTNGSTFTTLVGSAAYTFNPGSGNAATVTFAPTSTRYVRLTFTANTGWPAAQLSEFEAYQS
jgi:chitodextrinase